ncbi:TadE/TadG family type IV pilus assembly protein [Streptomyces parvus]
MELATLAIVILAVLFTIIQTGLYFHARRAAHSAARHGVESGRQFGASTNDGVTQAEIFVSRYRSVQGAEVSSAGSNAEKIRITVRGRAPTLVPGLTLNIVQYAEAPTERWTTP